MRKSTAWLTASLVLLFAMPAVARPCTDLLPPPRKGHVQGRALSPEDLVELRDIGPSSNDNVAQSIFDVSPDGKRLAFQVRQADPATNDYCFGIFTLELKPGAQPNAINIGGQFIPQVFGVARFAEMTSPGVAENTPPLWSPDGRWVAFIRRDGAFPQLWRASADGRVTEAVTEATFAVRTFAWTGDGRSLVFSGRPDLEAAKAKLADEGLSGFLYDDRFVPVAKSWPFVRGEIETKYFAVDLETRQVRIASSDERLPLGPPAGGPTGASLYVPGPGGAAWVAADETAQAKLVLHVKRLGREHMCDMRECVGIDQIWWSDDGRKVYFLTHDARRGSTALLAWDQASRPRVLRSNDDVLLGCKQSKGFLICARERATEPRRLVEIDLADGKETLLFDPNPEFQDLTFGPIERLYWRNDLGLETFGDLVLPPDHRLGQKHPLIVVQYRSQGFLRGGTGDEFPVQAFAARGFAVLNFTRPQDLGRSLGIADSKAAVRTSLRNWADRKSVLSSLEAGVAAAVGTGAVDPDAIGLTGLSDGSSTVQHALIHSRIVKAAAVATCCDEASTIDWLIGPMGTRYYHDYGFPALGDDEAKLWAPQSIVANAARIDVPLLMQLPDREYLGSLESYAALKAAGQPVEMYVYPDEYHIKWQPVHRLASYRRSLDWFSFWLKGEEDSDPSKRAQYGRWEGLRDLKRVAETAPSAQ